MVESVGTDHFLPQDDSVGRRFGRKPQDIGYKLLAVNCFDVGLGRHGGPSGHPLGADILLILLYRRNGSARAGLRDSLTDSGKLKSATA